MARPDPITNTYEELPDKAKELQKDNEANQGQVPKKRLSRETLLHNHTWHLKLLVATGLPPKNLILPPPYPPSNTPLSEGNRVRLNNLQIHCRNREDFILFRTVTDPYVYSSTVTIVEDEFGDTARLTVCNLEDSMNDPIISRDSILAIKQPCWSMISSGDYEIRIDQPSDLVFLAPDDTVIPGPWRTIKNNDVAEDYTRLKKEGDMMFLKKRFRQALQLSVPG